MIRSISLTNFRCLPDVELGPLARFNVLFGRNGSGKTSALEAIQLCLTARSHRIKKGEAETRQVVARPPKNEVLIVLSTTNGELARYNNGRVEPDRHELVRDLYEVETDPRKARFLINDLFCTHNLVYSEQIIEFLASKTAEHLRSSIRQLVLGGEIEEIWDRLTKAQQIAQRISAHAQNRFDQVQNEKRELEDKLEQLDTEDLSRLGSLASNLQALFPPVFWGDEELEKLIVDERLTARLREALVKTEEALGRASVLKELIEREKDVEPLTWADVELHSRKMKADLMKVDRHLSDLDQAVQDNQKEQGNLRQEVHNLTMQREINEKRVESLGEVVRLAESVMQWLPELRSQAETEALELSAQETKSRLRYLERASDLLGKLPSAEQAAALEKARLTLESTKEEIARRSAERADESNEIKREIVAIEKVAASETQESKRVYETLVLLHNQAEELLNLQRETACPLCGHEWRGYQALEEAIKSRFSTLGEQILPGEGDRIEESHELAILRHRLSELDREETDSQKALQGLEEERKRIAAQMGDAAAWLDEAADLAARAGIRLSLQQQGGAAERIQTLDSTLVGRAIEKEQRSLAASQARLDSLWHGLRHDEFDAQRVSLKDKLRSLPELLQSEIPIPTTFDGEDWREFLQLVNQKRKVLVAHAGELFKKVEAFQAKEESAGLETQRIEEELASAQKRKSLAEQLAKTWSNATEHVRVLADMGFAALADPIDVTSLMDRLLEIARRIKALLMQMETGLNARKRWSILSDQVDAKTQELSDLSAELKSANEVEKLFAGQTSPEQFLSETWQEYSKSISNLFVKLHWPPDFDDVSLVPADGESELKVHEAKEGGGWVLAAHRLSSGQRAALALAVFWAMNGRPENVPPLLLMDEPIQSVDDLNILNFLDCLRWLVEARERQVFLTTANQRVAGLIRRKFSYLGSDYTEFHLTRGFKPCSTIQQRDADGKPLGEPIPESASG